MTQPLRIVFMGTPHFAVPTLQALIDGPDEVVAVVTNPDRPAGRGKASTPPPVKVAALDADIPVHQPRSAKKPDFLTWFQALAPDLAIVVAYGQILPQAVLDVPRLGCINVHASVLPKLRGAAPINWAVVRGHSGTGVSIMQMERGLDSGPVFHIAHTPIGEHETAGQLHDRLSPLGAEALMAVLPGLRDGTAQAEVQDHDAMTYAPMMSKADGDLDWQLPAQSLMWRIHGFNPWPGAFTHVQADAPEARTSGKRLKVHQARVFTGPAPDGALTDAAPGTVALEPDSGRLLVCTGQGLLEITRCQAPGKKALDAKTFLRGFPLAQGTRLGPAAP